MADSKFADYINGFEVLKEILTEGIIHGSRPETGFIKGGHCAVCFSEVPFSGLKYLIQNGSRYDPYGLIFAKASVFKNGGRPVIYLPDDESAWIPLPEKWRLVRYEPGIVDFTFEREWRLKGDLNIRETSGFYLIVKSEAEKIELRNLLNQINMNYAGIFVFDHVLHMF